MAQFISVLIIAALALFMIHPPRKRGRPTKNEAARRAFVAAGQLALEAARPSAVTDEVANQSDQWSAAAISPIDAVQMTSELQKFAVSVNKKTFDPALEPPAQKFISTFMHDARQYSSTSSRRHKADNNGLDRKWMKKTEWKLARACSLEDDAAQFNVQEIIFVRWRFYPHLGGGGLGSAVRADGEFRANYFWVNYFLLNC